MFVSIMNIVGDNRMGQILGSVWAIPDNIRISKLSTVCPLLSAI